LTTGPDVELDDLEAEASPEAALPSDVFGLPRAEVRRRSLAGVVYLSASSFASLVIGFLASLVLARMLTPSDFGMVAIGSTATLIGGALADGGLGAGMVRRREPPTRTELRTLNGIQLALALAFCIPAAAIALGFGQTGAVTAIMLCSLPITMLQTPGRIVLYRDMKYDRQLVIDFGAQATYQVFCVVSVALGAGVWGLATGSIVRAVVGTVLTAMLGIGLGVPSLRGWRKYGSLVRFGLKFQASWFTWVAREQGINIVVGTVAGIASLGVWTFTNRIFQLASIAFGSLFTVGFPAMSNLLARGEDPAPVIARTVRRSAIAATFVFPPFAAACPELIPGLFGEQWRTSADIVPFICLSTLILGSIAVASTSYLSAAGRPGAVAWASAAFGVIWIAVTAVLLPSVGVTAIGIGNLCGALAESAVLDVLTQRAVGIAPHRPLLKPLAVAVVGGTLGWLLCTSGPSGLLIAFASAALTLTISAFGLWLLCRRDLHDAVDLVGGAFRSVLPRLPGASAGRA